MSRAWQVPSPDERLGEARPGALLTAAGAVPLAAAVLIAVGLLPWGARLAVGAALVVLGLRIRALETTTLGARIRPAVARAIGLALVVGGAVLAAAALGVALDGARLDSRTSFEGENPQLGLAALAGGPFAFFALFSPTLDAWAGVGFGALLVGAGVALARTLRPATVGVAVGGVGVALAVLALTGGGALGLGPDARAVVSVLLALGGAVVAVAGPPGAVSRAAGVAAGLVLALLTGEATGLVQLALGGTVGPQFLVPTRDGAVAGLLVLSAAIAAVLLVTAARRRDPVLGALPAGVLLLVHPLDGAAGEIGVLLVPVVLAALALAAAAGVEVATRIVPRPAAPAAVAVALVVLLVAVVGAFGVPAFSVFSDGSLDSGFRSGVLNVALGTLVGLGLVAAIALRTDGVAGVVATVAVLVGLHLLHPLGQLRGVDDDSLLSSPGLAVVLPLLELALGLAVARRHLAPPVLAALGLLLVSCLQALAFGVGDAAEDVSGILVVGLTFGPAVLAIVAAAGYALVCPAPRVVGAQAFAVGATVGALLYGSLATVSLGFAGDGDGATLDGGGAVLAVGLAVVALLGVTVLAASTARRASSTIAVAAAGVTPMLAMMVAAVASSVADSPGDDDVRSAGSAALQAAVGFGDSGSVLDRTPAGWPVLLAVLGAVLVAAGAWLESQRPLPPDAPVG
ncbi:hypothetical protein [Patulibacter minatonensis]|uniref:hypothetical protein n=1 Tax=Patulibacter minatonensis TaxID=298163 RepID=UPI000479188C|nr:hypothetical protein [Patulibacter minatonensis]